MNLVNMLAGETVSGCSVPIPTTIASLIRTIIVIIQIVVPILLIIWGMLDFAKSIIGQDEDKIKAGQKKFIQRIIAAIIVFLVVTVVQLVITTVGRVTGDGDSAWNCANAIINYGG